MKSSEKSVIYLVTIGSLFEWFDVFLFIYWAGIFAKTFQDYYSSIEELIYALLLISTGFFARPIGGLLFGWIGDRWGRKISFLISIIAITIPSIFLTLMPTFESWAYLSLVYLGIMRFLQGIPAGGELPGALCILSESTGFAKRRFMCSFLFVGPQIGQILSMLLCTTLQKNLTHEQLFSWGWRFSFGVSCIVGVIGLILRTRLHETTAFKHLKKEHKIEHHPLREAFRNHKMDMLLVLLLSIFEVIGFFVLYYYLFENPKDALDLEPSLAPWVYLTYLIGLTAIMPVIGMINRKYNTEIFFKISAYGIVLISFPFYLSIHYSFSILIYLFLTISVLLYCFQFSFLPSYIAEVFPTAVRFTCIGFSFNITDGVIGGVIPTLGKWLAQYTGNHASFILVLPISAIIFLLSLKHISRRAYKYG